MLTRLEEHTVTQALIYARRFTELLFSDEEITNELVHELDAKLRDALAIMDTGRASKPDLQLVKP